MNDAVMYMSFTAYIYTYLWNVLGRRMAGSDDMYIFIWLWK